jgi:hypothetical protein
MAEGKLQSGVRTLNYKYWLLALGQVSVCASVFSANYSFTNAPLCYPY